MLKPTLIPGNIHSDHRGRMTFANGADLREVCRFYTIEIPDTTIIRAWQGHKKEQKWFYPLNGNWQIKATPLNPTDTEGKQLVQEFNLNADEPAVLHLPGGYYNGFKALTPGAKLLVFSDSTLEESKEDDFRLSLDDLAWE